MIPTLSSLLCCPSCQRPISDTSQAICTCGNTWKVEDGSYLFIHNPVKKTVRPHVKQPNHWSSLRTYQYNYLWNHRHDIPIESVIVDIGAGEKQFSSIFDVFNGYFAMDFVQYPDVDIVTDLSTRWPIQDKSVDILIATNALEHFPDTNHVLEECARILRPGGYLYILVPFLMGIHQAPYDFVRHTHFSWRKLAEAHGFDIVDLQVSGTPFDTYQVIKKKMSESIMQEPLLWKRTLLAIPLLFANTISLAADAIYRLLSPFMYRREALALGYQMIWKHKDPNY